MASKTSYPSDEAAAKAERAKEEAERAKDCGWDKVAQEDLVKLRIGSIGLQSSTPEHERGIFATPEDGGQ